MVGRQGVFRHHTDTHTADSLANRLRRKRFAVFQSLMESIPRPCRLLDVGGNQSFWSNMGMIQEPGMEFCIMNLSINASRHPNVTCMVGDGRDMRQFRDGEFDVVFSNSVLEHVGGLQDQTLMANEVRRVGKRYFLQTPNRYFPIEPHYLIPFFQFMPRGMQRGLAGVLKLGWFSKESVGAIRLVSKGELKRMFPGATIIPEKFKGLNKSYMVFDGWGFRGDGADGRG
jgi:SAM-dependent methyltransferase